MANKVNIQGLLTGLAAPTAEQQGITRASAIQGTGLGSNLARSRALQAPQREQNLRQAAGGLFGVDTRTQADIVKEQLQGLDVTTPQGQQQAVALISKIDPPRALALQTQFNLQNREEERYLEAQDLEQQKVDIARARLVSDKEALGSADKKAIREATKEARGNAATARKMITIAEGFEKYAPAAGVAGRTLAGLNEFLGTQGDVDSLRVQFDAVRNQAVLNNLPPGAASDKDVALAMQGFPTKFWKPSEISSYLKGQAKLAALVAEGENARAKWLSENSGDDSGFADYWEKEQGSDEFTKKLEDTYGLVWEEAPEVDGSAFTVPSRPSVQQTRWRLRNG